MDEYNNIELDPRILPGVDLALWLRIIVILVLVAAAAGITLATA
jgi:hypothetical protein